MCGFRLLEFCRMRSTYSISKPTFLTWSVCLVIAIFSASKGLAKVTAAERTSEEAAAQITLPEIEFEDGAREDFARALKEVTQCDKLNIAALGNLVPQLHVHVIARRTSDAAWPRPVWGVMPPLAHDPEEVQNFISALRRKIWLG